MQPTLEDFFKAVRHGGLDVALDAQIDAARAAALVGWRDRALLRGALGTTLAKSVPDRALFDDIFDRFFHYDSFAVERLKGIAGADGIAAPAEEPAAGALMDGQGGGGTGRCAGQGGQSLARLLAAADSAELTRRMQQAARKAGLTDAWFFTQRGFYTQKIMQAMGLAGLDREIAGARREPGQGRRAEALEAARKRLFEEVRNFVESRIALYGTVPTRMLRDEFLQSQKLSHIERRDFARMHELIRKIARRLADRHSRRRRRELRGQLDFRRTLRANAAYGGVLFETHWRRKVIDRPRIVAICDVSSSVRQHSRFLLLFLYCLRELVSDLRAFAFTDRLVEAGAAFENLPAEAAVEQVIQSVGGSGTDYGQVLLDIEEQLMDRIGRRTTIIFLGDARNNYGAPRAGVMKRLRERARRIIWLNPEPASFWGLGDSEMKRYAPYCNLVRECNSLRHLERTLDALMRAHAASA